MFAKRSLYFLVSAIALNAAFVSPGLYAQSYSISTFDAPGSTSTQTGTYAMSLNDYGAVTGEFFDKAGAHGYIRAADGTYTIFDAPGATQGPVAFTYSSHINNAGEVLGYAEGDYPNTDSAGFLRTADGNFFLFFRTNIDPTALNANGLCVGLNGTQQSAIENEGFLRYPDGNIVKVSVPGAQYTYPFGINTAGTITGHYVASTPDRGFVRTINGGYTTFSIDNSSTTPMAINDAGVVAGDVVVPTGTRGFLRHVDGSIITFTVPSAVYVDVEAINSEGDIVGSWFSDPTNPIPNGFTRLADGTILTFSVPGASSTNPYSINVHGVIAGTYTTDGGLINHGFVATPD